LAQSTGDGIGVGIERDRPQLAGQVGDRDDVDAGNDQQQDVRRVDDPVGQIAFQLEDLAVFEQAVVVEADQPAAALEGMAQAGRR